MSTISISFGSGSPPRTTSGRGRTARFASPRRSTTGPCARRRTACSARRFSGRPRTGSATAASTSASGSAASSASVVASRSRARRCVASGWDTSSSPPRSCTSGTSAAPDPGSPTCSWAPRPARSSRRSSWRRSSTSPRTSSPMWTRSVATRICRIWRWSSPPRSARSSEPVTSRPSGAWPSSNVSSRSSRAQVPRSRRSALASGPSRRRSPPSGSGRTTTSRSRGVPSTRSRAFTGARSSRTSCCGGSSAAGTATTSRAGWEPRRSPD